MAESHSGNALNLQGKRVVITGGAGFIGSTLAGRLMDSNEVVIFDNFARNSLREKPFANHDRLEVIEGDVLDSDGVRAALEGANCVVHCAAIAGIDTVIRSPTTTLRTNLLGTANVLEAAKGLDSLERFVNFSTSEVFGQAAFRAEEGHDAQIGSVGEARWTYAVSKLAGEHLTKAYHDEFGIPTVTLRPFNIYGPGQVGEGAIRTFILRALRGETLEIHGDGNQIRAWCYIDDFIDGLMLGLTHPGAVGESFNIGNARAVITIYGLAQTIIRVLGSTSDIRFVRKDYADVELRVPSVEKAKTLLGFEAEIDLEEGIRRTAAYYEGRDG
jgi:UDP-glucose 4-epimerase